MDAARWSSSLCVVLGLCSGSWAAEAPKTAGPPGPLQEWANESRACVFKLQCANLGGGESTILSAVAIDRDGHLLTVGLPAAKRARLRVCDCDGKWHEARWIGSDAATGLTLLKVSPGIGRVAPMADAVPEVGSWVIVVGNPFGLSHSVSYGNISGIDRTVRLARETGRGLIQFTAPIHPGDSGGLLADARGRMIGIIYTALSEPAGWSSRRVPGVGFAIPVAQARRIAEQLRAGDTIRHGYLGITGVDLEGGGVRVTEVIEGSPAESAGLAVGDVILELNDSDVGTLAELAAGIVRTRPGTVVRLRVKRGDEQIVVPVTIGEQSVSARSLPALYPDPRWRFQPPPWMRNFFLDPKRSPAAGVHGLLLGVQLEEVSEALAQSLNLPSTEGALVNEVLPGSPAQRAGIRPSDLIVSVDDKPVRSPEELREGLREAGPRAKVKLGIVRDGKPMSVSVTLDADAARWFFSPGAPAWGRLPDDVLPRFEALERQVKNLEARVRELEGRLEELLAKQALLLSKNRSD